MIDKDYNTKVLNDFLLLLKKENAAPSVSISSFLHGYFSDNALSIGSMNNTVGYLQDNACLPISFYLDSSVPISKMYGFKDLDELKEQACNFSKYFRLPFFDVIKIMESANPFNVDVFGLNVVVMYRDRLELDFIDYVVNG